MFFLKNKIKNNLELVSLHVPKTGGTSFRSILKKTYGDARVVRFDINKNKVTLNEKPLILRRLSSKIRVVHGHFTYQDLMENVNLSKDVPIVTWVRDPVRRVMSNYYYLEERLVEGMEGVKNCSYILRRLQKTLIEYARDEFNCNRISKFLEGIDLEEFSFVGVHEYFNEDLHSFSKLFGLNNIVPIKMNVTKSTKRSSESIPQEIIDEIRELNAIDIELYEKSLALRKMRMK